ncbi:hypothetical protein PENSPDRAFT_439034 [Peniophora sp. CONT]|nr:hypothetical protein PENSPDRAFT_439034 [Peniophora sp. CONT]
MKKITEYMASSTTAASAVRSRRPSTSVNQASVAVSNRTLKASKAIATDSDTVPAGEATATVYTMDKLEAHQHPPKRRRIEPTSPATPTQTTKKARTLPDADEETEVASGSVKDSLESLERDTMGASWYDALQPELEKAYFRKLKSYLKTEVDAGTVYPALHDIYSWSRLTPLADVRDRLHTHIVVCGTFARSVRTRLWKLNTAM